MMTAALKLHETNAWRNARQNARVRIVQLQTIPHPSCRRHCLSMSPKRTYILLQQPEYHRTFCTIKATLSRTFSVPHAPDLPPRRHSSPMASSPLPASPTMTSISRFWLLTQRFTKPTGSRLISLRKACLALECAIALITSARWSS